MSLVLALTVFLAPQVVIDPPKPANDLARRTAYHQYVRGQEFLQSELYEKAVNEFQNAIENDRIFTDAQFGLGQAYMVRHQAYQRRLKPSLSNRPTRSLYRSARAAACR